MTSFEIGALAIAIVGGGALFLVGVLANRFFHDRIFANLTPGLVPPLGQSAAETKVQPGREYSGEIAVAFSPPRGLKPGLVGTIVDGKAEMRDLTATVVDLAVRGWVKIEAVDADATRQADPTKKSRDWHITLLSPAPAADRLDSFEEHLLRSLRSAAGPDATVLMSAWAKHRGDDLRALQNDLYNQTVHNRWYDKDPRAAGGGCLTTLATIALVAYIAIIVFTALSLWTIVASAILIAGAVFASRRLKRRVPRTALGTAVTIQALGFKKYLATAEADQFSFEEAAGVFSRYLPYALVFGVADHWAKVFGEVAKASEMEDGPDLLGALLWMDLSTDMGFGLAMLADGGFESMFDLGDAFDGLSGVAEGVGGFVEGVGDFISDLDFDL